MSLLFPPLREPIETAPLVNAPETLFPNRVVKAMSFPELPFVPIVMPPLKETTPGLPELVKWKSVEAPAPLPKVSEVKFIDCPPHVECRRDAASRSDAERTRCSRLYSSYV